MLLAKSLLRIGARCVPTDIRVSSSLIHSHLNGSQNHEPKLPAVRGSHNQFSSSLRVMCNGGIDGAGSAIVSINNKHYLFNCVESTQRVCQKERLKYQQFDMVFLTSQKWKNISGLIGFLVAMKTRNISGVRVKGSESYQELINIAREFVDLRSFQIDCFTENEYSDEYVTIKSLVIKRKNKNAGPQFVDTHSSVCAYIVIKKGSSLFSLNKCVDRGVPPSLLAKIKAGEDVILENGEVVTIKDVSFVEPQVALIILECPSEDYVDGLVTAKEFEPHQPNGCNNEEDLVKLIVHMTPKQLYESAQYQELLKKFHPDTVHVHLCETNSHELFNESICNQFYLNALHDEIFPLLPRSDSGSVRSYTTYEIAPEIRMVEDSPLEIQLGEDREEVGIAPEFENVVAVLKKRLAKVQISDERDYPKVIFLGTSSALPSADRNVTSYLIAARPDAYVLLDCGENTWGQMVHHYGREGADDVIRNLRCIFVSHKHIDHHMGMLTLLNRRHQMGIQSEIIIIGPEVIKKWLSVYSSKFKPINYTFLHSSQFKPGQIAAFQKGIFDRIGVDSITTCKVVHCFDAFGVRVTVNGFSIVFSGDTMISWNLVNLGRSCDILIHEATESIGREQEARKKNHCSVLQALDVANSMRARYLIMTHFSQRYYRYPLMDENYSGDVPVGCAFDHMEVSPKTVAFLPEIYSVMKHVYPEYHEELLEKTEQRRHTKKVLYQHRTLKAFPL